MSISYILFEEVYVREAFGGSSSAILLCGLLIASLGFAATPVASVTSTAPFFLNGAYVRVEGVPSWPVTVGDVIQTGTAPATILFKDGSRVTLAAGSTLRVNNASKGAGVQLDEGTMEILESSRSNMAFFVRNDPVATSPGVQTVASTKPGSGIKPRPLLLTPPPPPPAPLSTR